MQLDACLIAPDDWQRLSIKDICQRITSGGTPSRKKPEFYVNGTIGWVKTKELVDGFITSTEEVITEQAVAASSAKLLPSDTILLAMYGATVGMLGILSKEMTCNQACCALLVKPEFDRDFLFYQLLAHRKQLQGLATGAAQQNLSGQQIKELILPFPKLELQKSIGTCLRMLDKRISLLRETNLTLSTVAQAVFKSWFVDYDPVRLKLDGKVLDGMDPQIASLFPDKLEESEIGLIPVGWELSAVYDLASYINGAAYKAFEPNADKCGLPIIKIAELKSGVTETTAFSNVAMPKKYLIETRDILFSWSGNPDTSIDTFVWSHEAAWLNQHIFRVIPNQPNERAFVLEALKNLRPVFSELARNKQTTGLGHVTVGDLKQLMIVKPTGAVIDAFNQVVGSIQQRIFQNDLQINTLSNLRDTLLPRLISGQLNLDDVEFESITV